MTEQPAMEFNYVPRALDFFAQMGDTEALVYTDRRLTYAEVRSLVLAMASALAAEGIRPGMTVVSVTRNHPEHVALQLALHLLGCRTGFVPTYMPLRDQIEYVEHADAGVLIHDPGRGTELIAACLERRPRLVLSLGPAEGERDLLAALAVAPAQIPAVAAVPGQGGPPTAESDPQAALAAGEPQSLFHTSGTTGQPKLVLHRQRFYQVLFAGGQFYRASGEPPMRHLGIPAFSTTSGQMPALLALFQGGSAVLVDGFDLAGFLATIERERITSTFLGPLGLREMLDHPALATTDCSSLRYLNIGGSPPDPGQLARAIAKLGPVVRIVYGLTEAPLIADYPFLDNDPGHPERLRSCGKAFADTRIEIRGEDGKSLPTGEPGEVWAAGSLIMDEYFRQPGLTAAALVDGWLDTGDIGYTDADGYLFLVDRSKDVVITGAAAAKVYSRVVEDTLLSHPEVTAAAVIGVPDQELGEAVHAVVVTVPGAVVTAGELRDLVVREHKAYYAPKEVEFAGSLPVTPTGKVDKKALRARHHPADHSLRG